MVELDFEQITKEFLENNKKSTEKRMNFFNDIYLKIKKGNKESVDALKVIDKNYSEKIQFEKENLEKLKAQLDANNIELKNGLDTYFENYNIETETKKLEDSKEKGVQPKILIYRKEMHDASFKYDRVLKEEKEVLKSKQDAYDDFEKTYKNKILELEKRRRYEVNKEKNNTLNSYDDLQKSLLNTNNRNEIKSINKQIQDIRKVGLQNDKKIRLNYLNQIKIEDLAHEKGKKQFELDLNEIKKEFAVKKHNLEVEKKHINLNYQIELDRYDFGSRRALNNLNQKMIAKKNSLIISIKEKNKLLSLDYQAKQRENIKYRNTISNDFISVMDNNFNSFTDTINLSNTVVENVYFNHLYEFKSYYDLITKNLYTMISVLHAEYINNVINYEYENLKIIVNAKYNYVTLCKKESKEFISKLNELYESYKKQILEDDKKYEDELKKIFEEQSNQITTLFNNIKTLWKSSESIVKYHDDFKKNLNDFIKETKEYEISTYDKESNGFYFINSKIQEYNDACHDGEVENNEVNERHTIVNTQIDDDVKKYYEQKDIESKQIDDESKINLDKITQDYTNTITQINLSVEENIKNIEVKAISNIKTIEEDFTTQMNLLK